MTGIKQWRILFEAGVIACVIKIGLRFTSYARLNRILRLVVSPGADKTSGHTAAELYEDATLAVRLLPGRNTCLVRALAGRTLLQQYGHRATVRFGVRQVEDEPFHAHAWLERSDGTVLGEAGGIERFVQLQPTEKEQ